MAKIPKNQRVSVPPISSRSSSSRRRSNRFQNPAKSDVYEYQSHKVRRAHIPLSLDKDEAHEHGAASDDDFAADTRKPRLIGESVEDEDILSEDDEELDSDAAFEDTDEERFAGFSFPNVRSHPFLTLRRAEDPCNQSGRKTSRKDALNSPQVDLDDGDDITDSEEVSDSGDFIDVLDVLDGRADHDTEVVPADHSHARNYGADSSANAVVEEENDPEEDEEEEGDSVLSADEDVNPSALEGLEKFVSSLESSRKRKGDSDLTNNPPQRKRRLMDERTIVGVEGEFTAVTPGTSNTCLSGALFSVFLGQQLQLDDLIAPLASHSSAVLSLKKSVKILDASRTRGAPLSAPLPQRTQDRLDREAAYDQTKTEVDKWKDTMQQIKQVVLIRSHQHSR
jgi:U3 small nucleolar RNA-associated protein 14